VVKTKRAEKTLTTSAALPLSPYHNFRGASVIPESFSLSAFSRQVGYKSRKPSIFIVKVRHPTQSDLESLSTARDHLGEDQDDKSGSRGEGVWN
jgi:hypothetical protein